MKKLSALIFIVGLSISFNANAWFFFFLPTGAIADAITGASGDNCVGENTKIGDKIAIKGDVMIVKSISGSSSRCSDPKYPVRAELEKDPTPISQATTKASIEIPDSFINRDLNDSLKKGNAVFWVWDKSKDASMILYSINRSLIVTMDDDEYAEKQLLIQQNIVDVISTSPTKKLIINGANAWQKEVTGIVKAGSYKKPITYLITMYAGDDEFPMLKQWTRQDNFDTVKPDFVKALESLSNIVAVKESNFQTPAKITKTIQGTTTPKQAIVSPTPATPAPSSGSAADKLETLNGLLKKGLITQQDYDNKKAQILKSM